MTHYIVKALKTYLKSPLTASATSVVLRNLKDSKNNDLAMTDFGSFGVIVIKQGSTIEMIKFSDVSIAADGTATLTVAATGRALDPTYPYAGNATGETFQSGAEVIVTNDPLTVTQFGNINNANTWAALQTFSVAPKSILPTASDELATKAYVDEAALGSITNTPVVIPGIAGETLAIDKLVYLNGADQEWYEADADTASKSENVILGITRGAGTDGASITNGVTILGEHEAATEIFTAGIMYASDTAGAFATSAGTKEVTLGIAKSTTKIDFAPRYNQQLTEDQQDALAGTLGTPTSDNKYVTDYDTVKEALTGAITAFADAGGGQVTVTSAAHGLKNGQSVTISGTTSYNGTFTVANVTENTFEITDTWVADDATGTFTQSYADTVVRRDADGEIHADSYNGDGSKLTGLKLTQKLYTVAPITPTNDTNENNVFSTTLTGGLLSTTGYIKIRIPISLAAPTSIESIYTIRLYLDSVIGTAEIVFPAIGGGTGVKMTGFIEAMIISNASVSSQFIFFGGVLGNGYTPYTGTSVFPYFNSMQSTTSSIDTSSDKTLKITQQKSSVGGGVISYERGLIEITV
jgi:hypothetical protein